MDILFPVTQGKKKTVWISKTYPWADGWFAGGMTSDGEVTADVVYAGFGVTAPELAYDDYKDIDVKGKIVLVEGETPNISRNPDSLTMSVRTYFAPNQAEQCRNPWCGRLVIQMGSRSKCPL